MSSPAMKSGPLLREFVAPVLPPQSESSSITAIDFKTNTLAPTIFSESNHERKSSLDVVSSVISAEELSEMTKPGDIQTTMVEPEPKDSELKKSDELQVPNPLSLPSQSSDSTVQETASPVPSEKPSEKTKSDDISINMDQSEDEDSDFEKMDEPNKVPSDTSLSTHSKAEETASLVSLFEASSETTRSDDVTIIIVEPKPMHEDSKFEGSDEFQVPNPLSQSLPSRNLKAQEKKSLATPSQTSSKMTQSTDTRTPFYGEFMPVKKSAGIHPFELYTASAIRKQSKQLHAQAAREASEVTRHINAENRSNCRKKMLGAALLCVTLSVLIIIAVVPR